MITEQLITFLQNAVVRNDSEFEIIAVESNGYGTAVGVCGTITIDSAVIPTYWSVDGLNKLHGFNHDLIIRTPIANLISE